MIYTEGDPCSTLDNSFVTEWSVGIVRAVGHCLIVLTCQAGVLTSTGNIAFQSSTCCSECSLQIFHLESGCIFWTAEATLPLPVSCQGECYIMQDWKDNFFSHSTPAMPALQEYYYVITSTAWMVILSIIPQDLVCSAAVLLGSLGFNFKSYLWRGNSRTPLTLGSWLKQILLLLHKLKGAWGGDYQYCL